MAKDIQKKGWRGLSQKKKVVVVFIAVIAILFISCFLYIEVKNTTEIVAIDKSEFQRELMVVDNSEWQVAKKDYKKLCNILNEATGFIRTFVENDSLIVEIDGKSYGLWTEFYYDSGYIIGLVDLIPAKIYFSESLLKSGRALTLSIDGDKLVFYNVEK